LVIRDVGVALVVIGYNGPPKGISGGGGNSNDLGGQAALTGIKATVRIF
jgi:hypothetical protein